MALPIGAMLTLAACGGGGGELDGAAADIFGEQCAESSGETVTIFSGRSEDLISPVIEAFECQSGVETSVRYGESTELALLLNEEGELTNADVFLSRSPGPVGFLEAEGLLQPVDTTTLDLVSEENRSANGTWVGFSGRKRVLVYNFDNIEADELPESVFDLTDERFRGQVAIPATNGSFVDWFTVFRDQSGDDVATQWLEDMVANDAQFFANNRAIVEAASRGAIGMGLVNHYYNFQEEAAAPDSHRAANHDLAEDDIGSLLIITAATVTAGSENVDQANQLIQYLLSEPVQTYLTEDTLEYPLAAGVEPADVLPPLTALEIGSVDFDSLGGGFQETTAIIEASGILSQ